MVSRRLYLSMILKIAQGMSERQFILFSPRNPRYGNIPNHIKMYKPQPIMQSVPSVRQNIRRFTKNNLVYICLRSIYNLSVKSDFDMNNILRKLLTHDLYKERWEGGVHYSTMWILAEKSVCD